MAGKYPNAVKNFLSLLQNLDDIALRRFSAAYEEIGAIQVELGLLPKGEYADLTARLVGILSDPGDAGAIPVATSGHVPLVTGGAETRTLAAPSVAGLTLDLYFKTDGGNCVVTCATLFNAANNTLTFANEGEFVRLVSVESGADPRWRIAADPFTLVSTV